MARQTPGPSSHRYAGLRQQLQRAGQAEAWGHGQQPARVVPVVGSLEEQRRLFVPRGPGRPCCRLARGHLSHAARSPRPQHLFPRSLCASALVTVLCRSPGWREALRLRKPSPRQSQGSSDLRGRVTDAGTLESGQLTSKLFALRGLGNPCLHHTEGWEAFIKKLCLALKKEGNEASKLLRLFKKLSKRSQEFLSRSYWY